MVDSKSCHACSGALGFGGKDMIRWCHKVREMTRKQKRALSGRAGSVKTGLPSKKRKHEPVRLSTPYPPQHLSRCLAPQVFALTQWLCKPAGLGPQSQADAEKRGRTVRNRHWVHSQGVCSTHPVHRTGTKNLRKANIG